VSYYCGNIIKNNHAIQKWNASKSASEIAMPQRQHGDIGFSDSDEYLKLYNLRSEKFFCAPDDYQPTKDWQ
jgi:hypothetical protein